MKSKEYTNSLNWNYIIISIVVLAILTLLVLYCPQMRTTDYAILDFVRHALSPYPQYIPLFISEFGLANYMLWPLIAASSVLISHNQYLKAFLLVLFVQAAYFLKNTLKNFVCRERPEACDSGFSFPSGHCTVEMCFLGILIYLINRYVKGSFWRYTLITVFVLWLVMLSISRMWLGAHFLSDVLSGLFLGFGLVNLYIILVRAFGD